MITKEKYAIVILDGASGEPLAEFGNKTSLEAASTPYLDALARAGKLGLAKNVPDGLEPSSNVACMSICGLDPRAYPIGRGALEGAALGIDLQPDEVAMRLNLCNISNDGIMVSYSTDNISSDDGHALMDELIAQLDDDIFTLHKGTGFRGILVVKGHSDLMQTEFAAAHNMTDEKVSDYPATGPEVNLIAKYQASAKEILAQSLVNAKRIAAGKLPATDVVIFWPGQRPAGMESFTALYNKQAGMLSGVDLLNGIARLSGIQEFHFAGVTDGPDNDYVAQAEGAIKILAEKDVVFVHVEAPDAEGHDGNAIGKKAAIESIDRDILARLIAYGQQPSIKLHILALPDHPTPVSTKRHTREMVPFALATVDDNLVNELNSQTSSRSFTEAQAKATGLVVDPGHSLMQMVIGSL